jgi:hypothetical protein
MRYLILLITIIFIFLLISPKHKYKYRIHTKSGVYYLDSLKNENGRFYYINSDNKKWFIDTIVSIEVIN